MLEAAGEAAGYLALMKAQLRLLSKSNCSYANYLHSNEKSKEVCIKVRSLSASLASTGQVKTCDQASLCFFSAGKFLSAAKKKGRLIAG